MKKVLTLALGATMLMGGGMGVANAQGAASGPFADVPTDHWAYTSVEKLRDAGIVIGYPDMTYGGKRAMTRYEFAVAIARLLALIPKSNGTDMSAYALKSDIPSIAGLATVDQLNGKANQADLTALSNDLNAKLQQNQAALDALQALVNGFAPELKQMRVDVDAVKASLAGIQARLSAVEAEEQQRVRIEGDMSFIGRSNIDTKGVNPDGPPGNTGSALPIDKDGNRFGTAGNNSLFNSPAVYHDILLNIYGKVSDNAQAVIKIDAGNYLPWLVSATSQSPTHGAGINGEPAATTFNIYEAYLTAPIALGPLAGAEVKIGRQGTQFTKYIWKAVDPDSYTSRPETDSGDIIGDGIGLNFGLGGAHVQTFAEKNVVQNFIVAANPTFPSRNGVNRPGSNNRARTPFSTGGETYLQAAIDQSAGARVTFGNPDNLVIGFSGVVARTPGAFTSTAAVYGADVSGLLPFFHKSGLTIDANGAVDATGTNSDYGNVNTNKSNQAWDAQLGWQSGAFMIKGGYTQVYSNFNAPGAWGTLGSWTNPTNIQGELVSGSYAFSSRLKLVAEGNFYHGIQNNGGLTPLQQKDNLTRYQAGLQYGLTSDYNVDLGYEWMQWDLKDLTAAQQAVLAGPGKPTEQYITIGVGHDFNKNAAIKLLYQIIDYSDKSTRFDNPLGDNTAGGIAIIQTTVKF